MRVEATGCFSEGGNRRIRGELHDCDLVDNTDLSGAPTSSCVTSPKGVGKTSGIVIDNEVSNGGTNIYFSTLAPGSVNGQKCNVPGGTANPYCAVKLTQSALQ